MKKAKYLSSNVHEKGLEMWFEYRNKIYSIIRSSTYPESEYEQHQNEQNHIDTLLDLLDKTSLKKNKELVKDPFADFFKEIGL